MKKSVTVSVDSEKLSALEMYLGQKNSEAVGGTWKSLQSSFIRNMSLQCA
ncbi:MAG: hypothetical protein ACLSFT_02295 [Ruminococcus callidus]